MPGSRKALARTGINIASTLRVGRHMIGPGHPVFIIAEAGVNHNGDVALAKKLVEAAAEAGADAVKFQTFSAQKLVTSTAPKAVYQEEAGLQETQFEMLKRLELASEDYRELADHARKTGIMFLSTPFDEVSVDLLLELDVPAVKVGSGELTNLPLLRFIGRKRVPVLLSTGMASLGEIEQALGALGDARAQTLLFHCTSSYPAPPETINLRAMQTLQLAFQLPVGYSDHSLGTAIAISAVALGATAIEKHLTADRNLPGPDHRASLEPAEFRSMVQGIRQVEVALGSPVKGPCATELELRDVARKSIVAAKDIPAGTLLTEDMLALRRPGTGIEAKYLDRIVGQQARGHIAAGQMITWDAIHAVDRTCE